MLLILGCASISPLSLGISEGQWEEYSSEKQEKLLQNYSQVQAEEKTQLVQENATTLAESEPFLEIKIDQGEVMMPPFVSWSSYQGNKFSVAKNGCGEGILSSIDSETTIAIKACYYDNILYLDPTKYDPNNTRGTISFTYSPLWHQGFSYKKINTEGYVRLKDATVHVKLVASKLAAAAELESTID